MGRFYAKPGKERGTWLRVRVTGPPNRPSFGQIEEIHGPAPVNAGEVTVTIPSRKIHIFREVFPKTKQEILNLRVLERIRQSGLWPEGQAVAHRIKALGTTASGNQILSVLTLPESDVAPILELGHGAREWRLTGLIPSHASIAGLVGRLTQEPVLVAIFHKELLEIMVVSGAVLLHAQIVPLDTDGSLRESMLAQTFDMVSQTARRQYDLDISHFIATGPQRRSCPAMLGGRNILQPAWDSILDVQDPSLVDDHPDLFGVAFADPAYDLVPKDWKMAYAIGKVSKWASLAALPAIALLLAGTLVLARTNSSLEADLANRTREVEAKRRLIEETLPPQPEREARERLAAIWNRARAEHGLDEILVTLANRLPDGVKIKKMDLNRAVQGLQGSGETKAAASPALRMANSAGQDLVSSDPATLLAQPVEIAIELVTSASFSEANERMDAAIHNLQTAFDIERVQRRYTEETSEGVLSCTISPRGNGAMRMNQ
ncbi:MAG: hypothetical protein K6360_03150 [Deltaproteobacteria bacterium]